MRLQLKHIGKIESADILLNGLTIIAGVNDSGKSTVGKTLFSAVKALANTVNYNDKLKTDSIRKDIQSIYKRLNGLAARRTNNIIIPEELFPRMQNSFFEMLRQNEDNILNFFEERRAFIETLEITPRQKALIVQDLENIMNRMDQDIDQASILKQEFQSFIEAEFLNHISTIGKSTSSVRLMDDNDQDMMRVEIHKDTVKTSAVRYSLETAFQDATYIESPLYIHMMDILPMSETYREVEHSRTGLRAVVPYHIKDMAQKINNARYVQLPSLFAEEFKETLNMSKITGGRFVYDAKKQGLFWEKNGVQYSPVNVASGIKTFGIVQLLLETSAINQNKVLIWDEPENHLHPEWQIAFAQLLVELARKGFPIIISSHSPYFIQGIRYFASKEKIDKYTNYYLSEETEGQLAELCEVTNDLNRLFVKLAQPLNKIMNIEEPERE